MLTSSRRLKFGGRGILSRIKNSVGELLVHMLKKTTLTHAPDWKTDRVSLPISWIPSAALALQSPPDGRAMEVGGGERGPLEAVRLLRTQATRRGAQGLSQSFPSSTASRVNSRVWMGLSMRS